jgi:polyisoprenoid-binding protein YceI
MKRMMIAAALAAAVSGGAAYAATLSNADGQTCADGGTWHFVNNQIDGATTGTLTANFSGGLQIVDSTPDKVNAGTIHWTIEAEGTLLSGSSNLPGRLVLSDFTCEKKEEDPKS